MYMVRAASRGESMKAVSSLFLVSVSVFVATAACGPDMRGDDGVGDDDGSGSGMAQQCSKMDILFIVDDSNSMKEEQGNLGTNFPMFANLLSTYTTMDGQHIDFRVALTTTGRTITTIVPILGAVTEQGDNGAFKNNCSVSKRWLEPSDPNMEQTLACRANVGIEGPGEEMPLLMSKWALSERMTDNTNAGFLRQDALLALVVLTDEDDSSTTKNNITLMPSPSNPAGYPTDWNPPDEVQFLDTLKGHRSRWAAGIIAGDGDCTSSFGMAADGTRLKQFVNMANANGSKQAVFSSICAGDLTKGLKDALDLFQAACGGIIL